MMKEVQTKRILLLKELKLSIKLQNGIKQMAKKLGMFSVTHESVTVPMGRDRKIWTAQTTNQIARFITVPCEKKINIWIDSLLQSYFGKTTEDVFNVFQATPILVILLHCSFVEEVKKNYRITCT